MFSRKMFGIFCFQSFILRTLDAIRDLCPVNGRRSRCSETSWTVSTLLVTRMAKSREKNS